MPNPNPESSNLRNGYLAAFGAFSLWGVLPLYWKALEHLPSVDVVMHRLFWSLLFLWILLPLRGNTADYLRAFRSPKLLLVHLLACLLIGTNWFLYIWATLNDRIVEASMGYFISPLVLVAIGAFIFRESLNRVQKWAIGLTVVGLLVQLPLLSRVPWVAVALAVTFSTYGLVRKKSPLGSLTGLTVETTFYLLPCLWWLSRSEASGWETFPELGTTTLVLLILSGVVTAIPLLWFAYAARTLRFSTIGILQFLGPSLQFLIGVLMYQESMPPARWLSFVVIWSAVGLYLFGLVKSKELVVTDNNGL